MARGRPKKPFLQDPERYTIAMAEAFIASGYSQRKAYDLAACWPDCEEVEPDSEWLNKKLAKRKSRSREDTSARDFVAISLRTPEKQLQKGSAKRNTIDGRASGLRQKGKRVKEAPTSVEAEWLQNMGLAFMMVLQARQCREPAIAETLIRTLAAEVGEADFADAVLVPAFQSEISPA